MSNPTAASRRIAVLALCLILTACANTGAGYRPLVDSVASRNGGYNFEADLFQCQQYAAQVASAAQQAIAGAVIGAIVGAAFASVAGGNHYDQRAFARVGALDGALGGAAQGEMDQRNVIRTCMVNRGYSVLL